MKDNIKSKLVSGRFWLTVLWNRDWIYPLLILISLCLLYVGMIKPHFNPIQTTTQQADEITNKKQKGR